MDDLHPDDRAIEAFCAELKAKMAASRAKGRDGWYDPARCTSEDLSIDLRVHVGKGDPRDVALFCMMLWSRGSPIVGVVRAAGAPVISPTLLADLDRQIAADRRRKEQRAKKDRRAVSREGSGRRLADKV